MGTGFFQYSVEIKKEKYVSPEGIKFDKYALITFKLLEHSENITEKFGIVEANHIYKLIDDGKDIILDKCYVTEFSLAEYRKRKKLDREDFVNIKKISAINTFFDSSLTLDLSFMKLEDGNLDFEKAVFARGDLSFNTSEINDGTVNFSNVTFNIEKLDFSNAQFGSGDKSFKNATFKKECIKDFQYTHFGDGEKSFVNTEFYDGDASFINVNFCDGDVSFKVARFGEGKVDFHFARFGVGDISFERTEFGNGKVDFRTAEFNDGKINFNRSVFGDGEVSFEASELKKGRFIFKRAQIGRGNFDFQLAEFENADLLLDNTSFGEGSISFFNAKFKNLSLKSCHLDHYVNLKIANCYCIDLSDTIVRDIIDLNPYDTDVNTEILKVSGMKLLGRIYIDWTANKAKQMISTQDDTSDRNKAEQFRILKENFSINGHYNDEDRAYVEFKRYEAKADLSDAIKAIPVSRILEYPKYFFKWLVFDKMGLYATNPVRVLLSMLIGYLSFSVLYVILPLVTNTKIVSSLGDPDKLSLIAVAFYHSAITFLTIGYGDYYPSGLIRGISGFEGFVGLFLMSYFTVAFVRKILR